MKKSKRKPLLIIVISVITLLIAAGGGVFIFMSIEQGKMSPLGNQEVIPGIYSIRNGHVNIFLIQRNDMYIAIDAGQSEAQTREGLKILGISSNDVIAVLLTHSHGDHVGALKVFDAATVYAVNPKFADTVIADGETFMIAGKEFKVIGTPGHADDSVCFLYDGKYLFTGDNLSLKDGHVGLFNSVFNKSDERQRTDIQKLSELNGIEAIFTAHYGFTDSPIFP
jgi:glyoxylase-like metal-dependent hydrolase (beta-lactamase superfamily II)